MIKQIFVCGCEYPEIGIKWSLPDRDCYWCKHCRTEDIIFKRRN